MDWEAWRAIGHGIAKSRTRMSDYTARSFLQPPVFPAETGAHTQPMLTFGWRAVRGPLASLRRHQELGSV